MTTSKTSPVSVGDTVARITKLLESKGVKLFAVIDDTVSRITQLLESGTPVMAAAPLAA